ncbi:TrmO family methyltransferase [Nonomuraea sp. NPDC005983]|uniref:TrmO family methyltransferase domain-containing protein n=1 Tax=Nonomuraea sp. NPDC005983 TaxID=3155595 RepID=UPI0033B0347C
MTTDTVTLRPVGRVVGGRSEMVEDDWHDVRAVIRLDGETFTASAVLGLEGFSHLEVVFLFDRVDPAKIRTDPRPSRGNPSAAPVGIFAHRGPYRPCLTARPGRRRASSGRPRRGVGSGRHQDGLDIKPYLIEFAPPAIRSPNRPGPPSS